MKNKNLEITGPVVNDGKLYTLWSWILPLLLGLTLGWFVMACVEVWMESTNTQARPAVAAEAAAVNNEVDALSMTAFLRANPFGVTPRSLPVSDELEERFEATVTDLLTTALLKGTSPGHMAWMDVQGKLKLVMVGDDFGGYTLEEVTYLDATFVKGDSRVVKVLMYIPPRPTPLPIPRSLPAGNWQVVPPDLTKDTPGQISREMLNQLLEDPMGEFDKVRLRPAENGQGLQIQWINRDSILAQLGVQEGDVIRAINGIAFSNVMDIINALDSLMTSDQFTVGMMRNGAPISLQYLVR